MRPPRPQRRRSPLAIAARIAVALAAVPLVAPTCGDSGEGYKTFARGSLVIPMDVCYQYQTDGMRSSYAPASCPQAVDPGDVVRAYGLVYQLVRNGIAVYWVIDDAKSAIAGVDLTIEYGGGFPVVFYDWSPENPPPASPPTAGHAIDYRGGPFVVDGSDAARAAQVLQGFRATFQNVNVHVSNVAFRGYAKKTMAGGWNAGGTVPPKVALLDIGSTSSLSGGYAKNSEPIIRGYLARAGLDFPGAGGVAAAGAHGQIYDRLGMADLQPATPGGDWTTTNLHRFGYQILWVPHWFAPGSCANAGSQSACVSTLYPAAQRAQAVKSVGEFVAAGKDLFAECAGLGSFEGVASGATGWSASYEDGDPATHLHATNGLAINKSVAAADYDEASAASPLLQLGDYPFIPRTGAIQNFKPAPGRAPPSTYQGAAGEVKRLVADASDPSWDYFTYRPPAAGRGTTVYLGGHVYSGYSDTLGAGGNLVADFGTFQIGGTRLVLNTLFNLGATCTASGVACSTGQAGVCAQGALVCQDGQPVCAPVATPGAEACNGLDDDCDWEVDEGLEVACYDGPAGTEVRGECRAGVRSCVQTGSGYALSACTGQVLPAPEVCDALDNDCDGATDEEADGTALDQPCYEGPSSSIDPATGLPRPACAAGTQVCTMGSWGACAGQVLPTPENCTEGVGIGVDEDCNGTADDTCGCVSGETRTCYAGPPGTANVGACRVGAQTCTDGAWRLCVGEVLPAAEVCGNSVDEDCDTVAAACPGCSGPASDVGGTAACASVPSAEYPAARRNVGQCRDGTTTCGPDSAWGACVGETLPSPVEACDFVDNDCDGAVDEGAVCPTSLVCLAGVCVPGACGVEIPPPEGYACDEGGDADGVVVPGTCGDGAEPCPPGEACEWGSCVPPCGTNDCAAGSICGGGACVAGGCYATGCPAGELCRDGACVADACAGVLCPLGTFCRSGDCVQACTFVSCPAGQKCGVDGFCVTDPCAGRTCAPGERCTDGVCAANPCAGKSCAEGQVCAADAGGEPACVDDPCAGIACPAGVCSGGQCFSASNLTGEGAAPEAPVEGGCGCGSGGAAALPALLALLAAPLARRRRRGSGGGVALLALSAALLVSACKGEDPFDPAACAETCGEARCVDVDTDPLHCGACGDSCGASQICVDGACGPASAVAPYVRALSPDDGPRGALVPVAVQLSGERFVPGATVRIVAGAKTRTYPATFVDAGRLSVELDLSDAAAATWRLRVVNPDRVVSNALPFDVVVPDPSVAAVVPPVVLAGRPSAVLLTGTGFNATTQCRVRSASLAEIALVSTVDAEGVHCTVDATTLAPGAYDIWAVNEGSLSSNLRTLTVASEVATLASASPSSGEEQTAVSITLVGTGFDASSRVLLDGCAAPLDPPGACTDPTAPIVGTTFLDPTRLVAALSLPDCAATACAHALSVRNAAAATSNALPFTVAADQPDVTGFSPATAHQGDAPVAVAFTGSGFPGGSRIEVQPPGGAFGAPAVTPAGSTATLVTGTVSLVGQPEGSWLARVDYGSGLVSAAWPFRVLSNQAILRDVTAAPLPARSGAAGKTKTTVTLQVANLRPPYGGVRAWFRGPGGFARELDPPDPAGPTSPLVLSNVSLAELETGTYAFTVANPNGASESNAVSFAVTPGLPTLASVSPPAHAQSAAEPVVVVTLTGTGFAKPDASGNGGSVVHIFAAELGVVDHPLPSADTTVVSRSEIRIRLDVRTGLPGVYDVEVWNPSLPPPDAAGPQRSNRLARAFTIAP